MIVIGAVGRSRSQGFVLLVLIGVAAVCPRAGADLTIDLTYIGDAGNAADDTGYGSVSYDYYIGTYEVTVAQYVEFLNAKAKSDPYDLYNDIMGSTAWGGAFIIRSGTDGNYTYTAVSGKEDQPVRWVSWYDALRFVNWLSSGQGDGDTETGTYDLSQGAWAVRATNATWVLPTKDEWYKAAYYSASNALYYNYPNGSDAVPAEPTDETTPRDMNFGDAPYWQGGVSLTSIGETTGHSPYGVYDMGGNVEEYTETRSEQFPNHLVQGGGFLDDATYLVSSADGGVGPEGEGDESGFRVACLIPEPSTALLMLLGLPTAFAAVRRGCKREPRRDEKPW